MPAAEFGWDYNVDPTLRGAAFGPGFEPPPPTPPERYSVWWRARPGHVGYVVPTIERD